ncbi:MAG: DUF1926 domain-containing protein [Nitrospirae bacterium]|nr:MAG: DUF1926 domain-containing protein [Nitrospirota bacterium]
MELVDATVGRRLRLRLGEPATVALAPMRTVSQSEAGVDVCYQQSWIMAAWTVAGGARSWEGWLELEVAGV